jgi:hypothetical protein
VQFAQVSPAAALHVASPHVAHRPQSPGQLVHVSPAAASHVPLPQPIQRPQS